MKFTYSIPTKILFGPGSFNDLATTPLPGKKALIVITAGKSMRANGYLDRLIDMLDKQGIEYIETTSLEEAMPQLDILYMTRVQRERFFNEDDYVRLKDSYILTPDKLRTAKWDLAILHPLPRVNEISIAIDDDPRACYFRQVLCGKFIRMALILKLLEVE